MFQWVQNLVQKFWELFFPHTPEVIVADNNNIWTVDLQKYAHGKLSYAAVKGRDDPQKEYSQVDVAVNSTFVGVYDGHAENDAVEFVHQHLLPNIIGIMNDGLSEQRLREAFATTESQFIDHANQNVARRPSIYASGSSCLIALVRDGKLIICHLGNSRAVLGVSRRVIFRPAAVTVETVTIDHSVQLEDVRRDIRHTHGEETVIQDLDSNRWLIKGKVEVTRSFGDLYLKNAAYAINNARSRFYLEKPIDNPILSSVPSFWVRDIVPNTFLVLASDGLWNYLSDEDVVQFVKRKLPTRTGIAKLLIKEAIAVAEKMRKKRISEMQVHRTQEVGRAYDDITVVVLFFDKKVKNKNNLEEVNLSAFALPTPSKVKNSTSDQSIPTDLV